MAKGIIEALINNLINFLRLRLQPFLRGLIIALKGQRENYNTEHDESIWSMLDYAQFLSPDRSIGGHTRRRNEECNYCVCFFSANIKRALTYEKYLTDYLNSRHERFYSKRHFEICKIDVP